MRDYPHGVPAHSRLSEGEVMGRIEYDCKCVACGGTGLYVGMAERDGIAVVCSKCKGNGWRHVVVEYECTDKKRVHRDDISRVIECNPGICVYSKGGMNFGGMSYEDWNSGLPFVRGMEMREHVCPAWWYQCSKIGLKPKWIECNETLGGRFCNCKYFCFKDECWKRFDKEHGI